jgi:hypothetical protein
MTCHHTSKPHSSATTPDVFAYRYDGAMVYVPVESDYTVSPALHRMLLEADDRRVNPASALTRT